MEFGHTPKVCGHGFLHALHMAYSHEVNQCPEVAEPQAPSPLPTHSPTP